MIRFVTSVSPMLAALMLWPAIAGAQNAASTALTPAQLEAKTGRTSITLHHKDATPRAIVDDLVQQAGLPPLKDPQFAFNSHSEPATIDVDKQPFWLAVKTLFEKTKLSFDEIGSSSADRRLSPANGSRGLEGRLQTAGPFVLSLYAVEYQSRKRVSLGDQPAVQPDGGETLQLRMKAFVDPKVNILPNTFRFEVTEAVDDKGNSLIDGVAVSNSRTDARFSVGGLIPLKLKPAGATSLTRVKGVFRVQAVTQSQTWEVPNVADVKDAATTMTGETTKTALTVDSLTQVRPGRWSAQVSFQRPRGALEFSQLLDAMLNDVKLVDARGWEMPGSHGNVRGTEGINDPEADTQKYIGNMMFPGRLQKSPLMFVPAKLVWKVPVEWSEVVVPFEYTNVPLP